jgi:hypothetical protein
MTNAGAVAWKEGILKKYDEEMSQADIARLFGVTRSYVNKVIKQNPHGKLKPKQPAKFESVNRKVNCLLANGFKVQDLSVLLMVGPRTIHRWRTKQSRAKMIHSKRLGRLVKRVRHEQTQRYLDNYYKNNETEIFFMRDGIVQYREYMSKTDHEKANKSARSPVNRCEA